MNNKYVYSMNNYKTILNFLLSVLLLFTTLVLPHTALAQQQELELAEEYYQNQEYEKALSILEKYIKNDSFLPQIHKVYLNTLYKTQETKKAERYLTKLLKRYPLSAVYNIDYGSFLMNYEDSASAADHLNAYLGEIKKDNIQLQYAAIHFKDARMFSFAEQAYLLSRKNQGTGYYYELAELYLMWGKTDKMLDEYIELLLVDEGQLDYVQSAIQDNIGDEEAALLERKLIQHVQKYPNRLVLNEMLMWFYLQRKEFYKAFMQARAIDKRRQMNGMKIMSIGYMALNNEVYKDAVRIFEYLTEQYAEDRGVYQRSRRMLITAKAELVKNTFPIDLAKIESLVADYQAMIDEAGFGRETAEAARSMALLQAFYLDDKETAIAVLQRLIDMPLLPRQTISQAKLDLGDIYLLKEEPWEATLLYSQVEKAEKDKVLGHSAKLKNAKLHYYSGDFQLAKSHLDILKLATSREIANDAMDLSLLIEDNLDLDTTEVPMQTYAGIELLVFQGQLEKALTEYDKMLEIYPEHSLTDEILWEQANILLKLGHFQKMIAPLERIIAEFGEDILADDANFLIGKVYEEHLGNSEKAMEYYRNQLINYKGSVHNVEARKRFRILRGDKI